jgi:hypothetical protein
MPISALEKSKGGSLLFRVIRKGKLLGIFSLGSLIKGMPWKILARPK